MKIYIVSNGNENERTMFFGNKKEALKYYNSLEKEVESDFNYSCMTFRCIDVEPNKNGILYAMQMACYSVGASCGNEFL